MVSRHWLYRRDVIAACIASTTTALLPLRVVCKSRYVRKVCKRSRKPAKYRRAALIRPVNTNQSTPWNQILSCGVDGDFLVSTKFTRELVLQHMLTLFEHQRTMYNFESLFRKGSKTRKRKPLLRSVDLLGMLLCYVKTKGTLYSLCPIFAVTDSTIGIWLDHGLKVLNRVVCDNHTSCLQIKWPTFVEMGQSAALLETNRVKGPSLKGIFAVTDEGRMLCTDYTDGDMQNVYFEGFTQEVEVTNLFVFNFFDELIHAAVNYPGSWNDPKFAKVSGFYFPKLSDGKTPPRLAILGDWAFGNNTRVTNGKIVRGQQSNETSDKPESAALAAIDTFLACYAERMKKF